VENPCFCEVHHLADLNGISAKRRSNPANVIRGQRAVDLPSSTHRQVEVRRDMAQIDAVLCSNAS
jgi:hypothetical protein